MVVALRQVRACTDFAVIGRLTVLEMKGQKNKSKLKKKLLITFYEFSTPCSLFKLKLQVKTPSRTTYRDASPQTR